MKRDLPFAHLGILVLLLLIAINLLILDIKIFYPGNFLFSEFTTETQISKGDCPDSDRDCPRLNQNPPECPLVCMDLINQATSSMKIMQGTVPELGTVPNQTKSEKEYFIPLGTGQTSKNDWDNLISTETVINPQVYGSFKEAYFIVSLKNPTQNGSVEARLYNVTDNNVVYGSHLVMNGLLEQTINSAKFALPTASKLYRVQLKSTLGYAVSLENARLKLIAQ